MDHSAGPHAGEAYVTDFGLARKAERAEAEQVRERQKAEISRQQETLARTAAEKAAASEARAHGEEKKARTAAEADRLRFDGLRLAAEASAARHGDPGLALLLAAEAVRRVPHHLTFTALDNALRDCREARTLSADGHAPNFVRFSPDGRFLFTAGGGARRWQDPQPPPALWWDARAGKPLAGWKGYSPSLATVDLSPDGRTAAATIRGFQNVYYRDGKFPQMYVFTDRVTYLWDPATGKDRLHLHKHRDAVVSARFSLVTRKGEVINASAVHLWDAAKSTDLFALKEHKLGALDARLSPDGRTLLTVSDGYSRRLAVGEGFQGSMQAGAAGDIKLEILPGVPGEPADRILRLWDARTGKLLGTAAGQLRRETVPLFSPDSKTILATLEHGNLTLLDVPSGKVRRTLPRQQGWGQTHAAFSPDGKRLATADSDSSVRIWEVSGNRLLALFQGFEGHPGFVAFSADGGRLVTLAGKAAHVWACIPASCWRPASRNLCCGM